MKKKSSNFEVRLLQHHELDSWNRFAAKSPQGGPYADSNYISTLLRETGGKLTILGVYDGAELVAGCPVYSEQHRSGRIVMNRLLLYYNGLLLAPRNNVGPGLAASSGELAALSSLKEALAKQQVDRLVLHCSPSLYDIRPFLDGSWQVSPTYTFVSDLSDSEKLFERIHKDQRRLIRRAEEAGVSFIQSNDPSALFELHQLTSQKKSAPLYLPKVAFNRFFETLITLGLCKIFEARSSSGNLAASQAVILSTHSTTHTICAATLEAYTGLGAAPFLRWSVNKALADFGYKANDLTDAGLNSVSRFKAQLGSELQSSWILRRPDSLRMRVWSSSSQLARRATKLLIKRNG